MEQAGQGRRERLAAPARAARAGALALACALGALGGGCVGYSTYPPTTGGGIGADSPNAPHMAEVMLIGLETVIGRYPVEGPFVINFPEGMWKRKIDWVMERLKDPSARLVGAGAEGLPVYHVVRVMVRIDRAEVDIARPVMALTSPGGMQATQVVTVYLTSGGSKWRVDRSRSWTIGAIPAPPLHPVDGPAREEPGAPEAAPPPGGAPEAGAGAGGCGL